MALLGSAFRIVATSEKLAISFSMPTRATWILGSEVTSRAFPSLVISAMLPVSATAMLAPEIPMSAARNVGRSCSRATFTSLGMSEVRRSSTSLLKRSETSSLVMWMAGMTMCEGVCPANWMIHSPRSVSPTVIPAFSRKGLRWISSVAMDFDLTTVFTPLSCATFRIYSLTLAGSLVLKTFAPRASAFWANCSDN